MHTDTQRHAPATPTAGMTWIPAGEFAMGSADFYAEERPVHLVAVDGFWIDTRPVTVAEFRRFVKQTGHVTVAEQAPDPAAYPDARPDLLVPGSLVFQQGTRPGRSSRLRELVGVRARRIVAPSRRAGQRLSASATSIR